MYEGHVVMFLPAEFVGVASFDGHYLNVGGCMVDVGPWALHEQTGVYVRRESDDLTVVEIHLARHDGLEVEELREKHEEADRFPLGPKEYWRGEMVKKHGGCMTDEEFEEWWDEGDEYLDEGLDDEE